MDPELEPGRDLRQCRLGALATGQAVGDDSDVMAAVDLAIGEVENVTKDSTDRSAYRVQDAKRRTRILLHDQNRRSPMKTAKEEALIPIKGTYG